MGRSLRRMACVVVAIALVATACISDEAGTPIDDRAVNGDGRETSVVGGAGDAPPEFAWWETTLDEGDAGDVVGELRIDGVCIYIDTVYGNTVLLVLPFPQTTIDFKTGVVRLGGSEVGDGDRVAAGGGGGASRPEDGWPECDSVRRWYAHSLRQSAIDGVLDCAADKGRWTIEAEIDAGAVGGPAKEALESALRSYASPDGGVVFIDETLASVVVRRRELVIGRAERVGSGGFVVSSLTGCEGRQ